jgi:hypothetical protein
VATPTTFSPFQKTILPSSFGLASQTTAHDHKQRAQRPKVMGGWGSSKELVKYSFRSFEHHSIAYEFAISNNPAVGFPH